MLEARALLSIPIERDRVLFAWSGAGDGETCVDHRLQKSIPTGTGGAAFSDTIGLRLFECIVNGDRESRVRLLGQACIASVIPSKKNASAFSLLPWR